MHVAFHDEICLAAAVVALSSHTVYKRVVRADKRGGGTPLRGILWNLAYKDQHRKAPAKLIFLDVNAGGPVIDDVRSLGCYTSSWCLEERKESSAGAVLLLDVNIDGVLDGIAIAQVNIIEFGVRVLKSSSRRNP